LQIGDMVRIPPIRQSKSSDLSTNQLLIRLAQCLKSQVIFDDDAILIINKPAGIAVHGGSGLQGGVIEALRLQAADSPLLAPPFVGPAYLELVHRLDRQTSGCLLLARSRAALLNLQQQMGGSKRSATKHYLALLQGCWQGGDRRVSCRLRKNQLLSGERMVIVSDAGKIAESLFSPISCSDIGSLVRIELLSGRTHQARVHAVVCGAPIAGDEKYGNHDFNCLMQGYGLHRLFLHASSIHIRHPVTGKSMHFQAPLPTELQHLITAMGLDCSAIMGH